MRRLLAAVTAVLAVAAPASATHGGIHPTLRTERAFFACAGDVKVQNAVLALGTIPTWDLTPPTASVTQGAGCGYYENAVGPYLGANRTTLDAEWQGAFRGNIDSLTVDLHNIHVSTARATGVYPLRLSLFIDGRNVLADAPDLQISPVPTSSGAAVRMTFTVTGIGLKGEDGDGTQERTFRLVARSHGEQQSAWVWDTTEVPSGLTFNPGQPSGTVIAAR
jgi:hypothetical protein